MNGSQQSPQIVHGDKRIPVPLVQPMCNFQYHPDSEQQFIFQQNIMVGLPGLPFYDNTTEAIVV